MPENRIRQHVPAAVAAVAAPSASGFMACPPALVQGWTSERQAWVGQLYQLALERAVADAQSSPWYRRVMTASVN